MYFQNKNYFANNIKGQRNEKQAESLGVSLAPNGALWTAEI